MAVLYISTETSFAISYRTVSEFRRDRALKQATTETSLTATETYAQSDAYAEMPAQMYAPSNAHFEIAAHFAAEPAGEFQLPLAEDNAVPELSIQQALQYFDEHSVVSAPTSFVSESAEMGESALSQFMSRAVDLETAFRYAGEDFSPPQQIAIPLPPISDRELLEDDGRVVPLSAEDCSDSQELPMPDEPSLSSYRMLDQACVLKDPQETSSINTTLEKDDFGRVVRALYCGGESVRFQYDLDGQLQEFNYAGLQWTREASGWTAQDRQTEYFVDGNISVLETGALRIEREDVVRILKLSGTRIDEHKSGSRTESRKIKNKPSPYDLLAKAKAVNSIWLNAKTVSKHSAEQPPRAPFRLDLFNEDREETGSSGGQSMIPSLARVPGPAVDSPSNLTCVPTSPIELRSLECTEKLRSLEDELLEPDDGQDSKPNIRHKSSEYWLKCNLWITDRLYGQSSPKHLEKLDRLAELYFFQQKNDLSELTHLRALHIREQFFGKGQAELAANVRGLAQIYEARGNFTRAEELYKEAIQLQENGLRKTLFLYSEKVIGNSKLNEKLDVLFATIADLSRLYSLQGKQKLCAVVYEKALTLSSEISEREPKAEQALESSAASHLQTMEQLSISDLLT